MKEKKGRIDVNPSQGGLNSAFSDLLSPINTSELPAGQEITRNNEPKPRASQKSLGRIVLRRETAHRAGKTVVVVSQFSDSFSDEELSDWMRRLKKFCGCGGTLMGREMEVQGEQVGRVRTFFEREGFQVDGVREGS